LKNFTNIAKIQRHSHLFSTSEYAYITTVTNITMIPIDLLSATEHAYISTTTGITMPLIDAIGPREEDLPFTFIFIGTTRHYHSSSHSHRGVQK